MTAPLPRIDPRPGYRPDNHPNRNITPDDWMLRNLRTLTENLARISAREQTEARNG